MRTELYQWMKSLAFFHVLTTALLHILPDKRYEQYIRLFMGLITFGERIFISMGTDAS